MKFSNTVSTLLLLLICSIGYAQEQPAIAGSSLRHRSAQAVTSTSTEELVDSSIEDIPASAIDLSIVEDPVSPLLIAPTPMAAAAAVGEPPLGCFPVASAPATSPTAPTPTAPTLCGTPSLDTVIAVDVSTDPLTPAPPTPDVDLGDGEVDLGGGGIAIVDISATDPPAPTPSVVAAVGPAGMAPEFRAPSPVVQPVIGQPPVDANIAGPPSDGITGGPGGCGPVEQNPTAPTPPTAPVLCGSPDLGTVVVELLTNPPSPAPPILEDSGLPSVEVVIVDAPIDPPAPTPPSLAPVSPAPVILGPTLGPTVRRPGFPVWWELVAPNFVGTNLKRCFKRNDTPPEQGRRCAARPKTCYFGSQECPGFGASPVTRCFCDGKDASRTWTCSLVDCPSPQNPTFA